LRPAEIPASVLTAIVRSNLLLRSADFLKLYRTRYVDVEPLKSRSTIVSQLTVLTAELGELPAKALERRDAIEDFKAKYANRTVATRQ